MSPPKEPALTPELARLLRMVDVGDGSAFACITARREHGVKSVDVERTQLAIVLRGTKSVRCGQQQLDYKPGDLFVMTAGCRLDVTNRPDPIDSCYLTVAIPLCEEVLTAARLLWGLPIQQTAPAISKVPLDRFTTEILAWADAIDERHEAAARLALTSLTVRLCRLGHATVLIPPAPSVKARVRALVSRHPGRDWRSADFEQELGMSGATLRRRLAEEHTCLRDVISDVRLACALELLYTTRWPVKTVADKVGYQSASSFVSRFKHRYGLEPSQIGNT